MTTTTTAACCFLRIVVPVLVGAICKSHVPKCYLRRCIFLYSHLDPMVVAREYVFGFFFHNFLPTPSKLNSAKLHHDGLVLL